MSEDKYYLAMSDLRYALDHLAANDGGCGLQAILRAAEEVRKAGYKHCEDCRTQNEARLPEEAPETVREARLTLETWAAFRPAFEKLAEYLGQRLCQQIDDLSRDEAKDQLAELAIHGSVALRDLSTERLVMDLLDCELLSTQADWDDDDGATRRLFWADLRASVAD
ncbi:MAG: hypothetical protein WC822_02510 [Candidatus Paceibacterota bacterium]|jgi:hypothetical protein